MQKGLLLLLILFAGGNLQAQDSTKPPKRFTILPLPVVYYQPETRLVGAQRQYSTSGFGAIPLVHGLLI